MSKQPFWFWVYVLRQYKRSGEEKIEREINGEIDRKRGGNSRILFKGISPET